MRSPYPPHLSTACLHAVQDAAQLAIHTVGCRTTGKSCSQTSHNWQFIQANIAQLTICAAERCTTRISYLGFSFPTHECRVVRSFFVRIASCASPDGHIERLKRFRPLHNSQFMQRLGHSTSFAQSKVPDRATHASGLWRSTPPRRAGASPMRTGRRTSRTSCNQSQQSMHFIQPITAKRAIRTSRCSTSCTSCSKIQHTVQFIPSRVSKCKKCTVCGVSSYEMHGMRRPNALFRGVTALKGRKPCISCI